MGLTISQWDDLDPHDQAYAIGVDIADGQAAAGRCTQCGGPASECQDTDNQHAYVVTWRRCYRTRAVKEAEKTRSDHAGVVAVVTLDPSRKKTAQKE